MIHDVKPALLAFAAHGWQLGGVADDTALAAYLAKPDQRSYDLTDLALRYLQRELRVEAPDDGQLTLDGVGDDDEEVERNLMLRARATLDLAEAIGADPDRGGEHARRLLADVELPLAEVLARMEQAGIAADTGYLSELEAHFAAEVKAAAQSAYEVIGREFNLGSPKQLQEILFDELGLPKTKKIKTGYTTDADSLQWLFVQTRAPVAGNTCCATATSPSSRPLWTVCSSRSATTAASTPRSTRRSRPPAGCRAPTPTCRTSRSAPRRAARSGGRSWSAPASSRC